MLKYEEEVRQIIKNNINKEIDIDSIFIDTNLETVGMDSIGFVKLIVDIESEFDIEFPDDKLLFAQAGTIRELCNIIETCVGDI